MILTEPLQPYFDVQGTTIYCTADIAANGIDGIGSLFRDGAAAYDERHFNPASHMEHIVRSLAAHGQRPSKDPINALDIGCGSGNATVAICKLFDNARVYSTDLSPEMLAILVRRLRDMGMRHPHTPFVADGTTLTLADRSFDLIVGSSMVHHLIQPTQFLDKCLRALRPGGIAMFSEPFKSGHFPLRVALSALVQLAGANGGIDQRHLDFWKAYVFSIDTMCSNAQRPGTFYEKLEDKWMFSREQFESVARLHDCAMTIIPHLDSFRSHAIDVIWKGLGDRIVLPAWADDFLNEMDRAAADMAGDLLTHGIISYRKPHDGGQTPRAAAARPADEAGVVRFEMPRFVMETPSALNACKLRSGTWKFDYDRMDEAEIRAHVLRDGRPAFCAETFPGFSAFSILELGPSDGYNTAGLEAVGARGPIVAVEANTDGFLKACILKNALNLRAQFLLGDFMEYLRTPALRYDLTYASGVLYHMTAPLEFLKLCTDVSDHLFLWTFVYEEKAIAGHSYERARFAGSEQRTVDGRTFTYHKRIYDRKFVEAADYQGGVDGHAFWMTYEDIAQALSTFGFAITRTVADSYNDIPAMNILASRQRLPRDIRATQRGGDAPQAHPCAPQARPRAPQDMPTLR